MKGKSVVHSKSGKYMDEGLTTGPSIKCKSTKSTKRWKSSSNFDRMTSQPPSMLPTQQILFPRELANFPSVQPVENLNDRVTTPFPTLQKSETPSFHPSTYGPTHNPTEEGSSSPSDTKSAMPTFHPSTYRPTLNPTELESPSPSDTKIAMLSFHPSTHISMHPSDRPSSSSDQPTSNPMDLESPSPSDIKTSIPTFNPSTFISMHPSDRPFSSSDQPTSIMESSSPSDTKSSTPSVNPSMDPSVHTTKKEEERSLPSTAKSASPSFHYRIHPSTLPAQKFPTEQESLSPSETKEIYPTLFPTPRLSVLPTQVHPPPFLSKEGETKNPIARISSSPSSGRKLLPPTLFPSINLPQVPSNQKPHVKTTLPPIFSTNETPSNSSVSDFVKFYIPFSDLRFTITLPAYRRYLDNDKNENLLRLLYAVCFTHFLHLDKAFFDLVFVLETAQSRLVSNEDYVIARILKGFVIFDGKPENLNDTGIIDDILKQLIKVRINSCILLSLVLVDEKFFFICIFLKCDSTHSGTIFSECST